MFLDRLVRDGRIEWDKVEMFHLDEYIGLSMDHPASFRRYLLERLILPAGITRYHLLDGEDDPAAVCRRVGGLLQQEPVDVAVAGIGTRTALTIAVGCYSASAMLCSLGIGLRSFAGFRFLLGLGESANWPGATKAVAEWFPRRESGWAVALFDSGSSVGAALAPFIVLWVYRMSGSWRPAFVVTGTLGLLWIPLFRRLYRTPEEHPLLLEDERQDILANRVPAPQEGPAETYGELLTRPATWGIVIGKSADRSRVVLHHRLVCDLPGEPRVQAAGQPAGVLGPVHGRQSWKLRRRRPVEPADSARLAGGRRPQDCDRPWRPGHAISHPGDLHCLAARAHGLLRDRDVRLCGAVDDDPEPAGGHLSGEVRGICRRPGRHSGGDRYDRGHLSSP